MVVVLVVGGGNPTRIRWRPLVEQTIKLIDQFRCIKIQPRTTDLSTKLWGITTEFVGFIPQSLALRSIV